MTVTISSEDPRSIKAIEIAAGAGQWLKCRLADGAKAYGVPSQCMPDRYYLVDLERCTCEDFKRHGLSQARLGAAGMHGPCKHVLAVRLYCELAKAQQPKVRTRPVLDIVRHADGEITWERAARPSSPQAPASPPSPARPDIFKRFEGD